jgi:hypothetical protein
MNHSRKINKSTTPQWMLEISNICHDLFIYKIMYHYSTQQLKPTVHWRNVTSIHVHSCLCMLVNMLLCMTTNTYVIKVTSVMKLCTYAATTCTEKQRVIISVTESCCNVKMTCTSFLRMTVIMSYACSKLVQL